MPNKLIHFIVSALPLAIVGGLLYAGLCVKPVVHGQAVSQPVIERRDQFYGIAVLPDGAVAVAGSEGKLALAAPPQAGRFIWRRGAAHTAANLQALAAWDKRHLIAVGNEGAALTSEDGGANWRALELPPLPPATKLVRVRADADGVAYVAGENNTVLRTADHGKTWTRLLPEQDHNWYGLEAEATTILLVGEYGRIAIGRDRGAAWSFGQAPTRAHLTGVAVGAEGRVVAVGLNGTVLVSSDRGGSWRAVDAGVGEHFYDVVWNRDRFVACGTRGLLLESRDGERWSAVASDIGLRANFAWFAQVRPHGNGYLVAGSGLGYVENGHFQDIGAAGMASPPSN